MSECTDMRALRAEYDKIKQCAEDVVSQNCELRQERDQARRKALDIMDQCFNMYASAELAKRMLDDAKEGGK